MTICPKRVKSFGVSFTINPVTQTADVDVNSASIKEHSFVFAIGSIRRIAPKRITDRKPRTRICGGENFIPTKIILRDLPQIDNRQSIC